MADRRSRTPFHLLAKPTGATCNLDCAYCFFLSKEMLYPGSRFRMADELLETYIRQLLDAQPGPEVTIAWQGGEPTLMGLAFFERAVELAERYKRPDQVVSHTIQTNGTRLNDAWATFFKRNGFLVGLSMDGPQPMHDTYRVDKSGAGTFDQVLRGWQVLERHGVDVNILCAVHAANADHPLEVYRFFRDELGARYIQFIPIVERFGLEGDVVTEWSVRAEQFGHFLSAIFDEWVRRDVGTVFVITFDAALGSWVGQPSVCTSQRTCGTALALEHNGDLYSCDHFVDPDYLLGNILETPLGDLVESQRQRKFGQNKFDTLPRYCRECEVLFACYGECPRNRFVHTPEGEPGLNYLCAGYEQFFVHIDRPMRVMADLLTHGRYADEIMAILAKERDGFTQAQDERQPRIE